MSDSQPELAKEQGDSPSFELDTDQVDEIVDALDAADFAAVRKLCAPLHYADVADLLEWLSTADRLRLLDVLGDDLDHDSLAELDDNVRDEILEHWGLDNIVQAVTNLDSDDAVDFIEDLDEENKRKVLDAIPAEDRTFILESLKYPEDSAGRLMQRELVTVPEFWTVGKTIDFMRQSAEDAPDSLPEFFYDIYVVDPQHKPIGAVGLSSLLRTRRPVKITEVMWEQMLIVPITMDQEDVAYLFRQRDLVSAPVVDENGRLVGAITIDDIVDVIDDEHEEDMMLLAGVGEDDLYDAALDTTRSRFVWLAVNLLTAVLASAVISLFEATIEQIVALAVLMPIVASMGGNAGTQTLTVAVRGLATKELTATNATRVIMKELLVGSINGVLFAVIAGCVAWLWFDDIALGLVIALAMVVNMTIAGLAGTSIPILLERAGADPAIASSVFVTTVTDVVGFFAFLGLAALIML
ncbi:MAG: magnesium transporter [Rhodospirillales bacterium]|jgi:magnesium transporter|nr:magnesium transporter [Rhodospirillales bacterium]MBT4038601.1 magnesium transporter [Rhodospirillales bacterium]MBT4627639.1 magnesium transporter [Rhodospirillales bacterium]MBT5351558.1 magnesium transporter [Rhodospirillales bacterium]MBT5521532.1 magnesium transporter [Rhodospirillales bacterium]